MKRLRHPIRAIREPFGTAGLIVACLALVLAMGGAAVAASGGLTGKQKKEVEKIAKKYAGKPGATGPQGPAGSVGAAGAKGDKGDPGTAGGTGPSGPTGNGVALTTINPGLECEEGGVSVEVESTPSSKKKICNGVEGPQGPTGPAGSPWVAGTAPSGAVLRGTWAVSDDAAAAGEIVYATISTGVPIPKPPAGTSFAVARDPSYTFANQESQEYSELFCPGSAENPTAEILVEHGTLCVYVAERTNLIPPEPQSTGGSSTTWPLASSAVGGSGFLAGFETAGAGAAHAYGSWILKLQ